jgi:acylphosphatase
MIARQVFYSGRVQGVGFRAGVRRVAEGYEVTGWVKNLADGRVELQVMAQDSDELHDFLTAIDESDLASYIKERQLHVIAPLQNVRGFRIER